MKTTALTITLLTLLNLYSAVTCVAELPTVETSKKAPSAEQTIQWLRMFAPKVTVEYAIEAPEYTSESSHTLKGLDYQLDKMFIETRNATRMITPGGEINTYDQTRLSEIPIRNRTYFVTVKQDERDLRERTKLISGEKIYYSIWIVASEDNSVRQNTKVRELSADFENGERKSEYETFTNLVIISAPSSELAERMAAALRNMILVLGGTLAEADPNLF